MVTPAPPARGKGHRLKQLILSGPLVVAPRAGQRSTIRRCHGTSALRARSLVVIEDVPMLTPQAEDSVGFVVSRLRNKGDAATAMRGAGHRQRRHHEIQASPPRSEQATFPAILGVSPGRLLHLQPVPARAADGDAGLVFRDEPLVPPLDDLSHASKPSAARRRPAWIRSAPETKVLEARPPLPERAAAQVPPFTYRMSNAIRTGADPSRGRAAIRTATQAGRRTPARWNGLNMRVGAIGT